MRTDLAHDDHEAGVRPPVAVFPPPAVTAEVRHRPAPSSVPEHLAGHVVPVDQPTGPDYRLSGHFLASGRSGLAADFARWRREWMHVAALDRASSLLELADLFDGGRTAHRWAMAWATGTPARVDDPVALTIQLDAARRHVHGRSAPSFGFVDASRDGSVGLLGAWSSAGGRELISAGPSMRVEADPVDGLCLFGDAAGRPVAVEGIESVRIIAEGVLVCGRDATSLLPFEDAAPLTWLHPGCAHWRVRPVPEVVVWAKTFDRLREACAVAVDAEADVELWFGVDLAEVPSRP